MDLSRLFRSFCLECVSRILIRFETYVSVKSKLQHAPPPGAYPGHLTPLPSRGGGNLIIKVFQGVGNLIVKVFQGVGNLIPML